MSQQTGSDEHTPVTDEILDIIDQQPTNRYSVALRLTQWQKDRETALLQRVVQGLPNKPELQRYETPNGTIIVDSFREYKQGIIQAIDEFTKHLDDLEKQL